MRMKLTLALGLVVLAVLVCVTLAVVLPWALLRKMDGETHSGDEKGDEGAESPEVD